MNIKTKDFTEIYKQFAGLWVALDKEEKEVLGASKKIEKAMKKASESGEEAPILFKVPKPSISWVGSS